MGIDVVPLAPSDERAVQQAYEVVRAADLNELPDTPPDPAEQFRRQVQKPTPSHDWEWALAFDDGRPAGFAEINLPKLDNLERAGIKIMVTPELRRRGAGRALYEWLVTRARANGRRILTVQTTDRTPDGGAFAVALGAKVGLQDTRSRLDVTAADPEKYAAMLAEAWKHADGYHLVVWQGIPADAYIDDVAELDSMFITEAPLGDLEMEPEKVDAERIRSDEQNRLDRGMDRYHVGAVHTATDKMVAWTTLAGPTMLPQHIWQQITLVHPGHRGHRLGLIVKLENFKQTVAHRPGLEAIDTWNATSNDHMLAINRAMGFQAVDQWTDWQLKI